MTQNMNKLEENSIAAAWRQVRAYTIERVCDELESFQHEEEPPINPFYAEGTEHFDRAWLVTRYVRKALRDRGFRPPVGFDTHLQEICEKIPK
tara:strand:+ start:3443 stop:3721 length:279 start_codon:yes stop_codon:yes gene_type:complete